MKYEDCKKCPKYLCEEYSDRKDFSWLFSLGKIIVFPACDAHVTLKEFRIYVEDTSCKSRYNPYKNFETLQECINYINKKFGKDLDFENMIQLTKLKQELKNAT